MKRIFMIIYTALFILMISFSLALGQDKKSEQRIKIIVDDGSGTKVVIDTVFKGSPGPDSLMLKDGSVIYVKHPGEEADLRHHKGKEHYIVTYSSNGKDNVNEMKEVTVIGTDSTELKKAGDDKEVTYYRISETHTGRYGDNDSTIEKTKYVIAKDGMVVTVEGNDETKTKELVKEIENKLGVNGEGTEKKETVKVESKKIIKK
jgi:hypothetical protein